MTGQHATGPFEVNLEPLESKLNLTNIGRMSIDKKFLGDLDATSKGEMLSARTSMDGSAAYVALERVTGSLRGKKGSFDLIHLGIMNRGIQQATITVVPDSGTGELEGITGTMTIKISGGEHSYDFFYNFDAR
jgi:hypothetical protein